MTESQPPHQTAPNPSPQNPSPQNLSAKTRSPKNRKLGPRPLPLHLLNATTLWLASHAGSNFLKDGLPLLKAGLEKAELGAAASALAAELEGIAPEDFAQALDGELRGQADVYLRGLESYRQSAYCRDLEDPPCLWAEGTTRLLDYGPAGGVPLLVVPSLINRFYILDLNSGRSLLRFLSGMGIRPLVVDWGKPGEEERQFGLTEYVAGRLEAALEAALGLTGTPVALLGYCMGGLLALALARRRPRAVGSLALLATPWDFHAEAAEQARLLGSLADLIGVSCAPLGEVPVDMLQVFFTGIDPFLGLKKFTRFAEMPPDSAEALEFVAIEDWLNDGVPLALPTAREALSRWYGANETGQGLWRVAGTPIRPQALNLPALVVVPAQDRIVPPASAAALADALPNVTRLTPALGHIGMIVGGRAEKAVWTPLAEWVLRNSWTPGRTPL